ESKLVLTLLELNNTLRLSLSTPLTDFTAPSIFCIQLGQDNVSNSNIAFSIIPISFMCFYFIGIWILVFTDPISIQSFWCTTTALIKCRDKAVFILYGYPSLISLLKIFIITGILCLLSLLLHFLIIKLAGLT